MRMLVQIMKKCGYDSYLFMRPRNMPDQFIWRGLDGSEIKAAQTGSYNSPMGHAVESIIKKAGRMKDDCCVVPWGVGNHGGGPTKQNIDIIQKSKKIVIVY